MLLSPEWTKVPKSTSFVRCDSWQRTQLRLRQQPGAGVDNVCCTFILLILEIFHILHTAIVSVSTQSRLAMWKFVGRKSPFSFELSKLFQPLNPIWVWIGMRFPSGISLCVRLDSYWTPGALSFSSLMQRLATPSRFPGIQRMCGSCWHSSWSW